MSGADDLAVPDSEGQDIAASAHDPIPYVDGNATAGALSDVFRIDIIAALGRCRNCGPVRAFGEAMVFTDAPGIVVRCRDCQGVAAEIGGNTNPILVGPERS